MLPLAKDGRDSSVRQPATISARRAGNAIGFLICALFFGGALYLELGLGYAPSPLHVIERTAMLLTGVVFLHAVIRKPYGAAAWLHGAFVLLFTLIGVTAAWRQLAVRIQPPGTIPDCGVSMSLLLDLRLRDLAILGLTSPEGCNELDWAFLGLPLPAWILLAFTGLAVLGVYTSFVRR